MSGAAVTLVGILCSSRGAQVVAFRYNPSEEEGAKALQPIDDFCVEDCNDPSLLAATPDRTEFVILESTGNFAFVSRETMEVVDNWNCQIGSEMSSAALSAKSAELWVVSSAYGQTGGVILRDGSVAGAFGPTEDDDKRSPDADEAPLVAVCPLFDDCREVFVTSLRSEVSICNSEGAEVETIDLKLGKALHCTRLRNYSLPFSAESRSHVAVVLRCDVQPSIADTADHPTGGGARRARRMLCVTAPAIVIVDTTKKEIIRVIRDGLNDSNYYPVHLCELPDGNVVATCAEGEHLIFDPRDPESKPRPFVRNILPRGLSSLIAL